MEVVDKTGTAPKTLVELASSLMKDARKVARRTRDPNAQIEETWCVFDVDEHPLIKEACQQARDNDVQLAISNPSVELWFLLHFVSQTAYIGRQEAERKLKSYITDYNKNLPILRPLEGRYQEAKLRAQNLALKHEGDGTYFPENNPSSDLWKLVESLNASY